jgi:F0F1-type ATP synthase membrane subunit c/vacuolar-type H+-ATPase subunit K
MHLGDSIWVAVSEGLFLFGLVIVILVKIASNINK